MPDVADLWNRIEEARKRLGAAEETQIKQIADLNEQVKGVRNGLARRYRALEEHREAMTKMRQTCPPSSFLTYPLPVGQRKRRERTW